MASSAAISASRSRQIGRGKRLDRHEIDRSGHRCLQAVGRKARDGPDAGFARGEFRPVVGLAGAERCDDAHAGHDDDRPAEFIAWCCHVFPRPRRVHLIASTSAMPSPRQWPAPDHDNLGRRFRHFNLQPGGIVGRKQRAARDRKRRKRQSQRKLGFHGVAEHRAGRPHRKIRDACRGTPALPR